MADSNWKISDGSVLVPRMPEHALVWHIYESVFIYALVSGLGLWMWIELGDERPTVLCGFLCVLAVCIWGDLKKRHKLRPTVEARIA